MSLFNNFIFMIFITIIINSCAEEIIFEDKYPNKNYLEISFCSFINNSSVSSLSENLNNLNNLNDSYLDEKVLRTFYLDPLFETETYDFIWFDEFSSKLLYLEYENLFKTTILGRSGQTLGEGFGKGSQLGLRTTKEVKRKGCSALKDLIESDKLIIYDLDTITELTTFIVKGQSYEADEGYHDDLVMTLVLFGWMVNQKYFTDVTDSDLREKLYQEQLLQAEQNMLPFGFIDDGRPDEKVSERWGDTEWFYDKKYEVYNF